MSNPAPMSAPSPVPSDALKAEANAKFKDGKYEEAIALYTQAIDVHPTSVLFANRAFANIKLENYGAALLDSDEAITLDPYNAEAKQRQLIIDKILDKISKSGYDSLTKAEKEILFNQSKNG